MGIKEESSKGRKGIRREREGGKRVGRVGEWEAESNRTRGQGEGIGVERRVG